MLTLPTDFQTCMEELKKQKDQIQEAKEQMLNPSMEEAVDEMEAEGVCINPLNTTGLLTPFLIGSYHEICTCVANYDKA